MIGFLTRDEIKALLAAPDQSTWSGRRDHVFLLVALQTGLRLSELISLVHTDIVLGPSNYIRVVGKGRKQRATPLTKETTKTLKKWMDHSDAESVILFPSTRGTRLSPDAVQRLLSKHASTASLVCPSLKDKRVTPHVLRHSCAMELLLAGIDRSMIALWLGDESVETTQIYLHANLTLKEDILAKTQMVKGKHVRFKPDDELLEFLNSL